MVESIQTRRRLLFLAGVVLLATVVFLATQRGGNASASTSLASYPALASDAPSELPLISTYHDRQPGEAFHPGYPAVAPAPNLPVPSSIRKIPVSVPGVSLWIATTAEGGICKLAYLAGNPGMGVSCTSGGAGLASGVAGELTTPSGEILYAGVVPDGVSSVTETLPDGSSVTIPVTDNGWAYVYKPEGSPVASAAKKRHSKTHARKGHR